MADWSPDEVLELRRVYGPNEDAIVADMLDRSVAAVQAKARELALAKDKRYFHGRAMPRWTDEEEANLRRLYPSHPNIKIAKALEKSLKSVTSKAHVMGLVKNDERLRSMGRENVAMRRSRESRKRKR